MITIPNPQVAQQIFETSRKHTHSKTSGGITAASQGVDTWEDLENIEGVGELMVAVGLQGNKCDLWGILPFGRHTQDDDVPLSRPETHIHVETHTHREAHRHTHTHIHTETNTGVEQTHVDTPTGQSILYTTNATAPPPTHTHTHTHTRILCEKLVLRSFPCFTKGHNKKFDFLFSQMCYTYIHKGTHTHRHTQAHRQKNTHTHTENNRHHW
eukprot:GHVR01024193.1.p1 GENE.GHVR01024193.1~~GHVR01024193.1.p1  ORF type:complete len:212 (-),score=109.65 GHVR01024193.1:38-673(-)